MKKQAPQLVLSLMPGIDLLGLAFKREGFCVVQGGDVIFGGDIRDEHYPAGKFDGVIGGPPCQAFSSLVHIVRANGHEPEFGNLIPEFERVVSEARPTWFVMENVPRAPLPSVPGYATWSTLLNNRQCYADDGEPAIQNRDRRWTFGDRRRGPRTALMIDTAAMFNRQYESAACGGNSGTLSRVDKRRVGKPNSIREYRTRTSLLEQNHKTNWAFRELVRKQGLPEGFDLPPFRVDAKCKAVGNSVPIPMGRAIARAVTEATRQ